MLFFPLVNLSDTILPRTQPSSILWIDTTGLLLVLMAEYLVALKTLKSTIVDCFNEVDLMMHRVVEQESSASKLEYCFKTGRALTIRRLKRNPVSRIFCCPCARAPAGVVCPSVRPACVNFEIEKLNWEVRGNLCENPDIIRKPIMCLHSFGTSSSLPIRYRVPLPLDRPLVRSSANSSLFARVRDFARLSLSFCRLSSLTCWLDHFNIHRFAYSSFDQLYQ